MNNEYLFSFENREPFFVVRLNINYQLSIINCQLSTKFDTSDPIAGLA